MLKISSKLSIFLSLALCIGFLALCIIGLFLMPSLVEMLLKIPEDIGFRGVITQGARAFVMVLAYFALVGGIAADSLLIALLLRVRDGKVFTPASVALIRAVSWCCFFICLIFGILGFYFTLSYIVAFGVLLLGLCVRVCKNVIEEATEIKYENDLTV
ncbi:MAG: DUF2975 domain-containing protein [Clostridia bacterium]|nr:DUF2975 domain-containing protein [Clostridia bacterium]